ncbi:MAG: Type 1 glutamine amidotransferase-like domain-containing protein [Clostridium sp.]|nr:Type 1 glutamine amidotransferase-like domain-containing protein [Clostridium sp.]
MATTKIQTVWIGGTDGKCRLFFLIGCGMIFLVYTDKMAFDEVITMLILCSNGLSSEKLLAHLGSKMVDCKTAALVVTADNEYKENNYHVPRCVLELQALNLHVDIFDLDKQSSELLLNYDVVEFIGGNPFYLLYSIRENNAIEILRDIAASKILIGWSAAAFVFGPTLELVNRYSPEMNFLGLSDYSGLSLTNIQVLPHYSKFLIRFELFEENCCIYEREHNVNVIRINDGDGVFIDPEVYICKA